MAPSSIQIRCLDHDDDHCVRAIDLGAAHLLASPDLPDHALVTYHYILHRLMAEGGRRGQRDLHDLVDDFVVDMLSSIAANGAPLSAQFI